jgi:hypothetical protein
MRNVSWSPLVLLTAALVLAPGLAAAATVGGEVFGAANTYNMDDVNDAVEVANTLGADFDELSNGLTGGLGVRVWPNPNWMLSAYWEPLFVETKSSVTNETWNVDANSFQFGATYFFPSVTTVKYGIGAGIGVYSLSGETTDPAATPTTSSVEGTGPGFHVMALSEWTVRPGFAITAGAGYRKADIEVENSTGTADYSGFIGRLGMAFYLPSPM